MKILFFVSSLNAGGAERVATTLASAWARRGDTVLLAPTWLTKHDPFYALADQVRLVRLAEHMPTGPLGRLPGVSKWRVIRALVQREQPDVVVSFLTNVNVNVLIATMGLRVPVVVSERTHPAYSQSAGRLLRMLRRKLYSQAAAVVMQTQAGVPALKAQVPGVRDVTVIPNPLPDELLTRSAPASCTTQAKGYEAVAMGRLVPAKQFDVLIDAFATLAAEFPQWRLTIWGDGPQRDALQAQIKTLGLERRVRLAGRTPQPWDALSSADMFVMTSRVEGFPNVLLEAMALGLPCIALDCPSGPAELSRDGRDAVLVPMENATALQDAMHNVMADEALRWTLGMRAQASVRRRYGLPIVLKQWDDVFRRVAHVPRADHVA